MTAAALEPPRSAEDRLDEIEARLDEIHREIVRFRASVATALCRIGAAVDRLEPKETSA